MLKKTVMAAVAALLAVIAVPAQPSKTPGHESHPGQNRYLSVVYANGPNERDSGEAYQTEAGSDSPEWYTQLQHPDGMLVIVGLLTCGIIGWQSWETRKAAQAALKQAEVAMTAQRAWMTIAPGLMSPQLYPSWEPGTRIPDDREKLKMVRHSLPLLIKNVGKTPAQIDQFFCRYARIGSMAELPAEPEYGELVPQGGHWIIPGDAHPVNTDLETDNGLLYERHVIGLEFRQSFLFAFGILKYRDVHGRPHQTRFSFIYHFPVKGILAADGTDISKPYFRKDGPPKYNYAD